MALAKGTKGDKVKGNKKPVTRKKVRSTASQNHVASQLKAAKVAGKAKKPKAVTVAEKLHDEPTLIDENDEFFGDEGFDGNIEEA